MNLIDCDGLIDYFTDLFQQYLKEASRREVRFATYCLGKAAAYREVINILTKLKKGAYRNE